jgi:hypothetical protein
MVYIYLPGYIFKDFLSEKYFDVKIRLLYGRSPVCCYIKQSCAGYFVRYNVLSLTSWKEHNLQVSENIVVTKIF